MWTLAVAEGQRIKITFLPFEIYTFYQEFCQYDWVELDNFSKHCGNFGIYDHLSIISNTNILTVGFRRVFSDYGAFTAVWEATTEPPTYPVPTGCNNCVFPFQFGSTTFDTCIRVEGTDEQPWCALHNPPYFAPPTSYSTHEFNNEVRVSCSESDSSCPSLTSQNLISSPNYPQTYPTSYDKVRSIV